MVGGGGCGGGGVSLQKRTPPPLFFSPSTSTSCHSVKTAMTMTHCRALEGKNEGGRTTETE